MGHGIEFLIVYSFCKKI